MAEKNVMAEKQNAIKLHGESVTTLPDDLYIPPQALEVILESFTGPLDLLLYLIKKQNLDILAIPIAEITRQYVSYIDLMQVLKIELAADYLVMAAMLAEIKSRLLLPRPEAALEAEEDDPRAELVRRLLQYERFKQAADKLDQLPRQQRDFALPVPVTMEKTWQKPWPVVELPELARALQAVMLRQKWHANHAIQWEHLSLRQRMGDVLQQLQGADYIDFSQFFRPEEGRIGLVVTFIAVLELARQSAIELAQRAPEGIIYIRQKVVS